MSKIKVYNLKGEETAELALEATVFAGKENEQLVSQAVRIQLANMRNAIAHTKTRGEVSGGGKKPWKQKGTGNARAGSSRSPLWTGGGVTFGPRNTRNYSLRLNSKMRQGALISALTEIANNKKLIVVKDFEMKEISTKKFITVLAKLPIETGKILLILPRINKEVELSAANLPYVKVIKAENINIVDLLKYNYILTSDEVVEKITENLGKNKTK
ncbi:MAG: 50S ribosomal protein L4 [Candidatus Berkelbacteria bacterium]